MFRDIEVRQREEDDKIPVQMPACLPGEQEVDNFTHDGGLRKEEQAGDAEGAVEKVSWA